MTNNKRIIWIDQLKGFVFYFVILGHMSINKVLSSWIFSFHMPIYFLLSGFNFNIEKIYGTKAKEYLLKLAKTMLVPYFWMQLLTMGIRFFEFHIRGSGTPVPRYLKGMFIGNDGILAATSIPLYFILLLFLTRIALFFIVRITKGNKYAVYAISAILLPVSIFTQNKPVIWHLNVIPVAMFFMITGNILKHFYNSTQEKIISSPAAGTAFLSFLFMAAGAFIWHFNGRMSINGNYYGKSFFLAYFSAVFTSCGFALAFIKLPETKLFSFIGKNTLFYMGIHQPLLMLLSVMLKAYSKKPVYIICVSAAMYFALIPITLAFRKFAPFVLGQTSDGNGKIYTVGQIICTVGATWVPFSFVYENCKAFISFSESMYAVLSFVLYAAVCVILFLICRKKLGFVFLIEGTSKKHTAKSVIKGSLLP